MIHSGTSIFMFEIWMRNYQKERGILKIWAENFVPVEPSEPVESYNISGKNRYL